MATEHPFQHLFETLGRIPASHAESVNRQASEILADILTVPLEKAGRCILLRAPRAGHGKTHLLARIQHQLGASHEFVSLQASFGSRIDAASVMDDTLRRLIRQLPASGGLCILDLITRRLFSGALQPLVGSGEVPCQDREGALTALRTRPIETFDFHHPNAVTAHWARENFEVLGQRLSLELAQRSGLSMGGISFWVDTLFHFASAPLDNPNRVRVLADAVHSGSGDEMEQLEALLGLLTQLMRVVLVADDLEGFSADETAALKLAAFLGSLRQSVERLDVVLSLNQDIWESAFLPRLSGGLADRLSEVVVELEPLTQREMAALLDSRVPGLGSRVLERIDVGAAGTHARGLIRAAGMAWLKATAMDSAAAEAAQSSPELVQFEVDYPPIVSPQMVAIAVPGFASIAEADAMSAPEPELARAAAEPAIPDAPGPPPPVSSAIEAAAAAFESADAKDVSTVLAPHEESPAWPAPIFSPPEPTLSEEPGSIESNAAVGSAFQVSEEPPVFNPPVNSPLQVAAEAVAAQVPVFNPPPSSPFQVSAEPPVFNPPAHSPLQVAAEAVAAQVLVFNPPPSSPFQVSEEPPVLNPPAHSPFQVAAEAVAAQVPVFNPPPSSPFQVSEEPPVFNPPAHSPFQVAAEAVAAQVPVFNPPPSSPFQVSEEPPVFNPPVNSPFQVAAEAVAAQVPVFNPPPSSPFQVSEEPPVFNPPVNSPFQVAAEAVAAQVPVFNPPPSSPFQVSEEPPVFNPPVNSPFQVAAEAVAAQVPVFNPPPTSPFQVSEEPPVLNPPAHSPFQVAAEAVAAQVPVFNPPPTSPFQVSEEPPAFTPPAWQNQPAVSPFQIADPEPQSNPPAYSAEPSPVVQASPEPVVPTPAAPAQSQAPPSTADTDRVDDLLRQFRERYGRGSL